MLPGQAVLSLASSASASPTQSNVGQAGGEACSACCLLPPTILFLAKMICSWPEDHLISSHIIPEVTGWGTLY